MSTNPFDNEFNQYQPSSPSSSRQINNAGTTSPSASAANTSTSTNTIAASSHSPYRSTKHGHYNQHQHHRPATIHEHHHQSISKTSSNDFHSNVNSNSGGGVGGVGVGVGGSNTNNVNINVNQTERDPIWEARGVEWPLVSSFNLPSSRFNKLYKKSRMAGNALGIVLSYDSTTGSSTFGSFGGGSSHGGGLGGGGNKPFNNSLDKDLDSRGIADVGVSGIGGGGYGGALGGFMGKLIGTQNQNVIGDDFMDDDTTATHTLRPPRPHCIASANGWIMAAVESTPITFNSTSATSRTNQSSASSTNASMTSNKKKVNNSHSGSATISTHQLPPLRLVSRWNVRHGTSDIEFIPLPPPVTTAITNKKAAAAAKSTSPTSSSSIEQNLTPMTAGRIIHVFVDPTGCHTIISAQNGEAYYIHTLSMNNSVRKLKGFGPNADGSSSTVPGRAISELSKIGSANSESRNSNSGGSSSIQKGLSPGSYVTSVAWDRQRGTEGSTKKILLGTSCGELYEYSLSASFSSDHSVGGGSTMTDDGRSGKETGEDELPLLLVRLNVSEQKYGRIRQESNTTEGANAGAVSGLHFERLGSGGNNAGIGGNRGVEEDIIVLAVTSGINKQTRLHTYLSQASSDDRDLNTTAKSSPVDGSVFCNVFSSNESTSRRSFIELPGSINHADLKICGEGFAMRTETGIYYGNIDKSNNMIAPFSKGSSGIVDAGMLPYENSSLPVSIAITTHHFITLNETNEVRFINRIAKKTIQKERVDWISMAHGSGAGVLDDGIHGGGVGELIMDVRRPNQIWLWKSRSLIHISSTREDRDVWKFSLEYCLSKSPSSQLSSRKRGLHSADDKYLDAEFDNAKALCTNNIQKAVVTTARAKYHLSHNRIELAAKYMAQCPPELMPFAETSTQLAIPLLLGGRSSTMKDTRKGGNGLISYLLHKMQFYKARNDNVACTMIGAWLVELYLHERERNGTLDSHTEGNNVSQAKSPSGNNVLLQQFLSSNAYNMDAQTILNILCSHDATATECAVYAASSGDIGTAVNAALCVADVKSGALDALRVLSDSPIEQAEPFYYKYAFTLLCRAPMAASKSFLARFNQGLSATKLLPAFMNYEKKRSNSKAALKNVQRGENVAFEGVDTNRKLSKSHSFFDNDTASVTYFEGAITLGCRSPAIYNYLVSLYVGMDNENPLFNFISKHISSTSTLPGMQPKQSSPLDMNYALSTILQSGRHFRSAIKLYMGFGMRFRAVELAIKVDPDLAKELASESVERDEKKRLWLMIARHAAMEGESSGGKEVVSKILSVLNECGSGVLSIEDVLPFLPDVAQIDQFKDEICDALTSYSSKIEEYLKEMSDCDQTCNGLREEIRRLTDYHQTMSSEARCAFTGEVVAEADEPFYVFPSGYVFLEKALKNEVMPYLNERQQSKVESIEKEICDLKSKVNPSTIGHTGYWEKSEAEYRLESLQSELDGLIAAECPLTGSVMVDSIDRSFADSKEDELYIASDDLMMEA